MSSFGGRQKKLTLGSANSGLVQRPFAVLRPATHLGRGEVDLIDTHVHTHHSDGSATVRQVEAWCLEKAIGCCITDHNEIRGSIRLLERDRVPSVPSIEIGSREQIELILLFRTPLELEYFFKDHVEPFRRKRWYAFLPCSLDYLVAAATEMQALISLPHPYAPLWKNIEHGRKRRPAIERLINSVDCIEVLNGGLPDRSNRRALQLCEHLDRIPLGGSDSHSLETIGSVVVAFQEAVNSWNIFDHILNRQVFGVLGRDARPKYLSNAWHVAKRHSRKFILPSWERASVKKTSLHS